MKNAVKPPSVRVRGVHVAKQRATGGNRCVITQTTVQIQAPGPTAAPQAAKILIFPGLMICFGI